ncbi:type III polyketide synthase [Streptomyces phytophilus]|uniref:type III polyketide synthase n=1 Tax=Streptomyces phytophilus TaxID=722715 RepID=UPI0015F073C2|nr:3-oxoacyl-[acyl-carrier-protein] synthase III C-terminal domain-containing protein [Streptomyces phytophilus]
MSEARIVTVTFRSPPLVKMEEFANLVAADPGGDTVAQVIRNSAITTKGMAVNALLEDPRRWTTRRRMDRSLAEARRLGRDTVTEALAEAGLRPEDVGLFATVTTTTHSAPGLDALAPELGLRPDVETLSLGPMGCYAAVPAVSACAHWVAAKRRPAVLLAVDLFSPHVQPPPYDKEQAVVLTLFGDGAAAVVLLPPEADGEPAAPGVDVVDSEQLTAPAYADDLQVHMGDSGLRIRLKPSMPDVVASSVAIPARALLSRHRVRWADVAWWAVHPGGRRILDRVDEALGLPEQSMAAAREVMREYGNTAAPAVLGVLRRLQETQPLAKGEHGVVLACGPGATVWALLLRGT